MKSPLELDNLEKLTVVKLKEELSKRQLDTKGNKAALIARLRGTLKEGEQADKEEKKEEKEETEETKESESLGKDTDSKHQETRNQSPVKESAPVARAKSPVKAASPTKAPTEEVDLPEKPASPVKTLTMSKPAQDNKTENPVSPVKLVDTNQKQTSPKKMEIDPTNTNPQPKTQVSSPTKMPSSPTHKDTKKRELDTSETPAKKQKSESGIVHIKNFTRPLNIESLKAKLGEFGIINEFWQDKFRTRCIVHYSSVSEAEKAQVGMNSITYQPGSGKILEAKLITAEEAKSEMTTESTKTAPVRSFSENVSNSLDRDIEDKADRGKRSLSMVASVSDVLHTKTLPSLSYKPYANGK